MGTEARESSRHAAHAGDRKRKTSRPRSSERSSDCDSDADSERRHRKRAKHKKKDDKKKSKKSKKSKKASERARSSRGEEKSARKSKDKKHKKRHARGSARSDSDTSDSGSSSSDSESERKQGGGVDLERAAEVVRTLLVEFPSISSDLLALLQMLDDGETAVISGIANARVKALLRSLFPLLGLKKLRKPDDAFVARSGGGRSRLLETVATMLTSPSTADTASNSHDAGQSDRDGEEEAVAAPTTAPRRREAPIGPMMPPPSALPSAPTALEDEEEEDDVVGPALPGMKGYREADERVEAEMARRAKQLEEDEWRRARGEVPAAAGAATGGREAWMTEMPTNNKIFDDAMGPMKPRTGQPAAFRSKEPAKIDSTWFDSPEERERGKRAKLDMELLGYVRPENAPAPGSSDQAARMPSNGLGVNESILPAANPEADEDMRRQMEVLKQKRGPSLLEQHQKKVAEEQKALRDSDGAAERSTWNRDRDLTARRGLSQSDADRIIKASQEISSKFTAPTVTRQFL